MGAVEEHALRGIVAKAIQRSLSARALVIKDTAYSQADARADLLNYDFRVLDPRARMGLDHAKPTGDLLFGSPRANRRDCLFQQRFLVEGME
jgi:hypothetical protein